MLHSLYISVQRLTLLLKAILSEEEFFIRVSFTFCEKVIAW